MSTSKFFKGCILTLLITVLLLSVSEAGADGTATVTVFCGNPGSQPAADNRMYQMIEQQLGIRFQFSFLTGNLDEAISLMIEGEDYPDLIDGSNDTEMLINAGALIDLLPYINPQDTPNLYRHLYTGNRLAQLTDDEGKLYIIPNYGITYNNEIVNENNGPSFYIQKKVIAWNNYVIPTTIDEYFDLLDRYLAAHPTDAEGNPNAGFEILCEDWRNWGLLNPVQHLMGRPNDGIVLVDVSTSAYKTETFINQDYAKGYYQELNRQYNAGVLRADTFSMDYDTYIDSLISGNVLGMFDQGWNFGMATNALRNEGRDEDTYLAIPLVYDSRYTGGKTIQEHYMNGTAMNKNRGFGISVSCQNPGTLVRMFDILLSDEWQTKLQWGIEGVDYTLDENGRMVMTEEQYNHLSDANWKLQNSADALFSSLPKKQGTMDNGNAWDPNCQPEVYFDHMSEYDRAFLAACGLKTPGELFNAPIQLAPYGEAWMIDYSPIFEDYEMFINLQVEMLPGIITCSEDQFETKWAEFIAAITPYAERVSQYMQEQILTEVARNTPANSCGADVVWTLDEGILTISGTGAMYNYHTVDNPSPWDGNGQIKEVRIESGVTSIGDYAFFNCGLENLTIPDTLTRIGNFAFFCLYAETGTSITSITIPDGVISIGTSAFAWWTSLESVTIPESVTSIGAGAFVSCFDLTEITIPDGVTIIGDDTFYMCSDLRSITIPSTVTCIGKAAFYMCDGLTDVYYTGTDAEWALIEIGEDNEKLTGVVIHYGAVHEHQPMIDPAVEPTCTELGWTEGVHCSICGEILVEPIKIPADHDWGSVICIWNEDHTAATATRTCKRNTEHQETETTAEITHAVTESPTESSSGTYTYCAAFSNPAFGLQRQETVIPALADMQTMRLPENLEIAEQEAFAGSNPEAVILSEGCEIGTGAFAGCSNIRYVWIPKTVTNIGDTTFADAEGAILDYETDHDIPVLTVTIDAGSYDYAQSVLTTARLSRPDGSTAGIVAAYPEVYFAATLCTEDGEPVDGFIIQSTVGPEQSCGFPMSNDEMPAGYYKIRVETDIPGVEGESPVFYYTADRSHAPAISECSIEIDLSSTTFKLGELFRITATVRDPDNNPIPGVKVGFAVLDMEGNYTNFYSYDWLWNLTRTDGSCSIRNRMESDEGFEPGIYTARVFIVDTNISAERRFIYSGE